jgi:hypothetical protein
MSRHMLTRVGGRALDVASTTRPFTVPARSEKQRLVILGSGWGGYGVLRKIDKTRYGTAHSHLLTPVGAD